MITDLKKENFDLKLRLYHLEDLMTKELDIYQLNDEVNTFLKRNQKKESFRYNELYIFIEQSTENEFRRSK